MIADGALKDVAAIFALHCDPQLPAGQVGVRSGPFTAAADKVEVRLTGPGGHTARPHLTVDWSTRSAGWWSTCRRCSTAGSTRGPR